MDSSKNVIDQYSEDPDHSLGNPQIEEESEEEFDSPDKKEEVVMRAEININV